jgi:hypothetical protein
MNKLKTDVRIIVKKEKKWNNQRFFYIQYKILGLFWIYERCANGNNGFPYNIRKTTDRVGFMSLDSAIDYINNYSEPITA